MKSQMSVEIDAPIQHVFDCTIHRVTEWSGIVVEDEVLNETPEGVGTTFRVVTEDCGKRMTFEGVVTRQEPPTLHAFEMRGKAFDIIAEYKFEDLGGRTRVTQWSKVQGKGVLKVVFFLFGWLMAKSGCDALEKELSRLKRLAETGQTEAATV